MSGMSHDRSGITLTYAGPEALLDSPAFGHLLSAFQSHLPLRNLHWKPSAVPPSQSQQNAALSPGAPVSPAVYGQSAAIRTIQTLHTRLEPLSDTLMRSKLKPETRHLVQRNLLERPFCHLYFVVGDDSDAYRSHIRNDIRAWLGTIQGTPTLSAATITARAFQAIEGTGTNGQATPRSATPPIRPDTPTRSSTSDDPGVSTPSTSKEKLPPTSPEYLIVVITPSDAASLALPSSGHHGRAASPVTPNLTGSTTVNEAPRTGLQRFYSSNKDSPVSSSNKSSGVIEKVKADFNTSRKERVISLNRLPSLTASIDGKSNLRNHSDPTIFAELTSKIKESVASTFDAVVAMQDDAVRKELAKKDVPGWNYNKWAAGMECLASTFESAGLFADALAHYEEIESVFLDCLAEKKLPFFNRVGATEAGDDSALLLDLSKKDYRDLILRNDISLFDFRCYLFARRAHLLAKMGRISQVMLETPTFLASIASLLQAESLAPHFLESWTYSSASDVVEQCQAWLIERGDVKAPGVEKDDINQSTLRTMASRIADSQLSPSFHAAKAELLDTARRQLDRIGIQVGHLPKAMPFNLSLGIVGDGSQTKSSATAKITRQELLESLNNREVFDLRYVALTERILAGWISCGRRRNVLRLRCILGSLDYFRARYSSALDTFAAISEPYAENLWRSVEAVHLARQLHCHSELKMPRDKAWIYTILALLRTQDSWDADQVDKGSKPIDPASHYLDEALLYSLLRTESKSSEAEIPISRSAGIEVTVRSQMSNLDQNDAAKGLTLLASVESKAQCAVVVDDVRICLKSGSLGEAWFTSGRITLQSGKNEIRTTCVGSCQPGKFTLELTQVRLGKVILQNVVSRSNSNLQVTKAFKAPIFIDIPEDGDALDFTLDWAPHVFLDRSRTGVVTIRTGRSPIAELRLRVLLASGEKLVRGLAEAAFHIPPQGDQAARMSAEVEQITLTRLAAQMQYLVLLPFHEVQGIADGVLQVNIVADYCNLLAEKATGMKTLKRSARLLLGLPLGVNVQDFFRQDRLLSKFLISAGAAGPLRLADVDLWSEEEQDSSSFTVQSPSLQAPYTVSTDLPSSFVFTIRKKDGRVNTSISTPLRLTLVYRTAHEEAIDYLFRALEELSKKRDGLTSSLKRSMKRALAKQAFDVVDQDVYASEGRVVFQAFQASVWRRLCSGWCEAQTEEDVGRFFTFIREVFVRAEALSREEYLQPIPKEHLDVDAEIAWLQEGRRPWRKLSLPVEVPTMTLINAVSVRLLSDEGSVHVGEPVEAEVTINSSYAWNDFAYGVAEQENAAAEEMQEDEDFADAQSDISNDEIKGVSTNEHNDKLFVNVDVNCDFVNWLLSGVKRTTIELPSPKSLPKKSREARSAVYPNKVILTLVALQSGQLSLPSVSIWPMTEPLLRQTPPSHAHRKAAEQEQDASQANVRPSYLANITSDTYIVNEAETVSVLPRRSMTTSETFWVTS